MERALQTGNLASPKASQGAGDCESEPFALEHAWRKWPKRAVQVLEKGAVGEGRALGFGEQCSQKGFPPWFNAAGGMTHDVAAAAPLEVHAIGSDDADFSGVSHASDV